MADIGGIFNRSGAPADRLDLEHLAGRFTRGTGSARPATWSGGAAALVSVRPTVNAEDDNDTQPHSILDERYKIVADARLYNRRTLLPLLFPEAAGEETRISDSALLLAAYLRWGDQCMYRLAGDYVFAVWDRETGRLVLARDPLGKRELFLLRFPAAFMFSSNLDSLLRFTTTEDLDTDYLVSALDGSYRCWPYRTPYKQISRLPPGSFVIVDKDREDGRQGYVVGENADDHRGVEEQGIVDRFTELFTDVVLEHSRSKHKTAVLTSGGIDSASIAVTADSVQPTLGNRVELLHADFQETPSAREREFFDAVSARCSNASVDVLECDKCWGFKDLGEFLSDRLPEPEPLVMNQVFRAMVSRAASTGANVVLTGDDVEIFGWLTPAHPLSLRYLSFRRALRNLSYMRRGASLGYVELLALAYAAPLLGSRLKNALPRRRRRFPVWITAPPPETDRDCYPATGVSETLTPEQKLIPQTLLDPFNLARNSATRAVGRSAGLEVRLPFSDVRILEFCLRLSENLRFIDTEQGLINKALLRRAMVGLPDHVRNRVSTTSGMDLFDKGLEKERKWLDDILSFRRLNELSLIDPAKYREEFFKAVENRVFQRNIFCPIAVETWLRLHNT